MSIQFTCSQGQTAARWLAMALTISIVLMSVPRCAGEQPTATAVITDRAALPTINQFSMPPSQFRLAGTGDVFFSSGFNTGLFRWSRATGARTRLLQTNDPIEVLGLGAERIPKEYSGLPLDVVAMGGSLQTNAAGHAAMAVSVAIPGERDPAGIFVYDGSAYRMVDSGNPLSSLRVFLNDSDRVAFQASSGYFAPVEIRMETVAAGLVTVARQMDPAPGTGGGTYGGLQIIGFNHAGRVAFLAEIQGGNTERAVFISDGGTPAPVVKNGDPVPGTSNRFRLRSALGNYMLNAAGEVAFATDLSSGPPPATPGIWIGSTSAPPAKVMRLGEPTESDLGGKFSLSGPFVLRDFNDAGQVLFSCDVSEGTSTHALFLKDLSPAETKVVFSKGQAGGPAGSFDTTQQASLNNAGNVAFLATLTGGSSPIGFFLRSGAAAPVEITVQGKPTPIGGKFGLAGQNYPAFINESSQVVFLADILDLNAVGIFSWTSGGGVRSVVSSRDSLPPGANTRLGPIPATANDKEVLVRVLKAGGQATCYAKELKPGMGGLRKIVAEFDQVPGAGAVVIPGSFSMNGKGEVVFTAALLGSDSYPRRGILGSLPGSALERVVLSGDDAPGYRGGKFTAFSALQLNNQTQVAFFASTDVQAPAAGIFIASKATASIKAVVRNLQSGFPGGGEFGPLGTNPLLNDKGQVAFRATKWNAPDSGLFVGTGDGTPVSVVKTGDAAPFGTVTGIPNSFRLNDAGQVAYVAFSGPSPANPSGVFLGTPGAAGYTRQPVALTGDTAPGAGEAKLFFFREESINLNSAGQVAFYAGLSCGYKDPPCPVRSGWYLGSVAATPSPRLLEKQPLPGGGEASFVWPGGRVVALANSGEMAIWVASVTNGVEPRVVIADAGGSLRKFATSGEKADGTGSEFGKLYPTPEATPLGRFVLDAMLVRGPARAGLFIDRP